MLLKISRMFGTSVGDILGIKSPLPSGEALKILYDSIVGEDVYE